MTIPHRDPSANHSANHSANPTDSLRKDPTCREKEQREKHQLAKNPVHSGCVIAGPRASMRIKLGQLAGLEGLVVRATEARALLEVTAHHGVFVETDMANLEAVSTCPDRTSA